MSSLTKRGAPKSDPTHPARRRAAGHSDSSSDGVSSDEELSVGELEGGEEEDNDDEERSPSSEVSSDNLDLD